MKPKRSRVVRSSSRATAVRAAAAVMVLTASACSRGERDGGGEQAAEQRVPECPGDGFVVTIDTGQGMLATYEQVPGVGALTNIPEYHDCQRFVKPDGTYDTRYAIFATLGLDSLGARWMRDSAQQGPSAALPARRLAAVIYSWNGTYTPLGIRPSFNCLYMYRDQGSWQATMLWLGSQSATCASSLTGSLGSNETPLLVNEIPQGRPAYDHTDYPPVARWDWDSVRTEHFISIKCDPTWCEIGDRAGIGASSRRFVGTATFPPDDPIPGPSVAPKHRWRTAEIKGWYDEQQLAVANAGGGVRPGPLRGAVFPHMALGRHQLPSDFANAALPWMPAAYAQLDAAYKTLQGRNRFDQGLNRISLCYGTMAFCGVPAGIQLPASCSATTSWWVRIDSPRSEPRFTCAVYRPHANVVIWPTARWRWQETDETIWIRCTPGCCELQ